VATRSNNKLAFKFYGPFPTVQRVGSVACKLQLPAQAQIHLVVHVSQLKHHVPPQTTVSTDLSTVCTDPSIPVLPLLVLDRALHLVGGSAMPRILVKWNMASNFSSWEDEQDLRLRFPITPAWGQAATQGGRNVTTE
jgi:hypothetical protein